MCRIKRVAAVLATAMGIVSLQVAAHVDTLAAEFDAGLTGRVSMEGAILSSACDITTGDTFQTINMPSETRSHIKRVGEGEPEPFSIYLTGCSLTSESGTGPGQYIQIIFDGNEESGLFRVDGSASGVALEFIDSNGDVIRPGKMIPYQAVMAENNRFDYQVRLKTTMRDLLVGDYHAIVRYRVEYF